MKKQVWILGVITASLLLAACGQQSGQPQMASAAAASGVAAASVPAGLEGENKQFSYMVGYDLASQLQMDALKKNGVVEIDTAVVLEALNDQMAGKPSRISPEMAQTVFNSIREKMQAAAAKIASETAVTSEKFMNENKTKEGVKTTASGLQYKINKEGTGAQVSQGDVVMVEYEGRLLDGTVFDSTQKNNNGNAVPMPVLDGAVIPGWIEGMKLMKEGGEYTLYIPAKLAYGTQPPSLTIPANAALVFDVKVVKVEKDGVKKAQQAAQTQTQAISAVK